VGRFKKTDYTVKELRDAAKCPPIAGVIGTILREVASYGLVVNEKDPTDDDTPKRMLEQTIENPNDFERTYRVASASMMRDWLVLGKSVIQLLRSEQQAGFEAYSLAKDYRNGVIDADEFYKNISKAVGELGPIMGWMAHDPANIRPNVTSAGVWKTPAFYDVSALGPFSTNPSPKALSQCPSFTTDQMVMIPYTGITDTERRLDPPSPTSEAYPLIDILYTMLVLLKNKLDRPQMDRLLSFVIPKDAQQLTPEQATTLITTMREDLAAGTLPVLPYVQAMVSQIGMGETFLDMWERIFQEIARICWQIFGAGGVQMLSMEGQGRQAATQQMVAARKQAIGNMLRILSEDFVKTTLIRDRHSPYRGLETEWVDRSADILSLVERLEKEHIPLLDRGYPLYAVLAQDYPEKLAILEAAGYDAKDLELPQIMAALIKLEGRQALGGSEPEGEGTDLEEIVEALGGRGG